ncbi:MAG: polysaccharide biosynthesis protein [Alphaproteobacteria bacterium]|nr:polysaccharide biosynthesis protein [Alphaproteobacteria bacterium]
MIKLLLKKIAESTYFTAFLTFIKKMHHKLCDSIELIPRENRCHIENVLVLILSYTIVSILLYPELCIGKYLKEVFSLLCAYGAIFMWFVNRISECTQFKVTVGVTACIAPVLFINNQFGVACVCLLMIVVCEFVVFEYLHGCYLFADTIPVYIVCDDEESAELFSNFSDKFKVLELLVLSGRKNRFSRLNSISSLREWLQKINHIPFFPFPRRLMYFSQKMNADNLAQLLELSSEFSVPLFKVYQEVFDNVASSDSSCGVAPASFFDFDAVALSSQDKTNLAAVIKGKKVWIYYDGRSTVLDLIHALSSVGAILTVLCETENLAIDAEQELVGKRQCKNFKIKIVDLNAFDSEDVKPDILFYNMPIKSFNSSDSNLRDAVIKNVLGMYNFVKDVQAAQIPQVFILSGTNAMNADNWVGATQRLGELFAQFANTQSKKTHSKFKIVRIPDAATDQFGIFGKVVSSVLADGCVNIDYSAAELLTVYHRKDVLPLLARTITLALKTYDSSECVYTIMPKNGIVLDDLIKHVCNVFCLRKDQDVHIVYTNKSEPMELENFPNIAKEVPEKTSVANVFSTKLMNDNPDDYSDVWKIEEIRKMSTRDLISAVYQSLNQKLKK